MKIQKFEDIIAWQKTQDLAVAIYKSFNDSRDFGFKDQIQRASVSISNNIAEGFDRMSDKEFVRFLYTSLKCKVYEAKQVRMYAFQYVKINEIN